MITLNLPDKIETQRLKLERLRYEFAEEMFFAYASKPEATRFVSWPTHKSIEDTRTYLSKAKAGWKMGLEYAYVIRLRLTNQLIGSIGCVNDSGKVQFGYIISPTFWNHGIATETCNALLFKLKELSNVYRIWTFTDAENCSSQRVLLKCGLVEDARLAQWFHFSNQENALRDCVLFKLPDEFLASHLVSQ